VIGVSLILQDVEILLADLRVKRVQLKNNFYSLDEFDPKDMPLAIYDYVIKELTEVVDKERE
jgi:hypothetical protein